MSDRTLRVEVPGKINLHLQVLARRPDGYHELQTLYQAVDIWDRLSATSASRLTLASDSLELDCGDDNLVLRAARLLQRKAGVADRGAALRLEKAIPVRGGMGGGSADAAAALILLDRWWELRTPEARMQELAAELGSDVPFFLRGGSALGLGRGERIQTLPFVGDCHVLLLHPPFGIATAEAFAGLGSRLTLPRIGVSLPRLKSFKWPQDNDFGVFVNDLESVVFDLRSELRSASAELKQAGARVAMLSGSGSTVFGLFDQLSSARRAAEKVGSAYPEWRVVLSRFVRGGVRWGSNAD